LPNREPANLIIDLDDTLAEATRAILHNVNSRLPTPIEWHELTRSHREANDGPYFEAVQAFLAEPERLLQYEPCEGAREALTDLAAVGYELHLVSARKEPLHEITVEWVRRNRLAEFFRAIHGRPGAERGFEFKLRVAGELQPVAAFDDTLEIAEALGGTGISVYLIDKPWNVASHLPRRVRRIESFVLAAEHMLGSQQGASRSIRRREGRGR
jgi:phosphoglycolate phosphatase-like HAD superfamily hydrolase